MNGGSRQAIYCSQLADSSSRWSNIAGAGRCTALISQQAAAEEGREDNSRDISGISAPTVTGQSCDRGSGCAVDVGVGRRA